jgi:NAD-dependent deacetylase
MNKKIVVFSGAGMSEESGLSTFRDSDGLWNGHDFLEVASLEGFNKNPQLVLEFYNQRRRQLLEVSPNPGHVALAQLEKHFNVSIVTQNVDNLHERAGSETVLHLHGELLKSQSSDNPELVYDCTSDISLNDKCPKGSQIRPHIVWFGEAVTRLDDAIAQVMKADVLIIVGTSLQVHPAAGIVSFAKHDIPVYYIDANPTVNPELSDLSNLTVIKNTAANGIPVLAQQLMNDFIPQKTN